jgi:hypothetical protein
LSMAYYDLFILLICILPQLARLSRSSKSPIFRAAGHPISDAGY